MPNFANLITDARAFYGELAANNRKDWWETNKTRYEDTLKAPALALLEQQSPDLAGLTGLEVTTKLFRPHRDVRFSKDKTPYKTHLHMMWVVQTGARQNVVFFFGIGLDYLSAGAGIMSFDKPVLEDWRLFVDQDHKRILKITNGLIDKGYHFREPALKRVPAAYAKDHPAETLLRMKGCVASRELGAIKNLDQDLGATFNDLWSLNALLIQIVEA